MEVAVSKPFYVIIGYMILMVIQITMVESSINHRGVARKLLWGDKQEHLGNRSHSVESRGRARVGVLALGAKPPKFRDMCA